MRHYLRNWLPRPATILNNRWLSWLKPWLTHPRLWCLHRRSVALGVAIGLLTGLIPGPVQMLVGILIAIPLRANVLATAFATLYTNPLTFIPLYVMAYSLGAWITGESVTNGIPPAMTFSWAEIGSLIPNLFAWIGSLGSTLLIGLLVQGTIFALLGYLATMLIWRCVVSRLWKRRHITPI